MPIRAARVRRAVVAGAAALGAALRAQDALASPQDVFGFGPRETALGATGAASCQGVDCVHGNPALLSLVHERQLTLGVQAATFSLTATGANAPGALSTDGLAGSIIGAVLPVPLGGALRDRVTLGAGFFTPFTLVVRAKILYPERVQAPAFPDRTQSAAVQVGLGADLGYGVRVGAGFAALAALTGDVSVANNILGQVGTTVDEQLVASYAPIFGAAIDLGQGWRAGATFRGKLQARLRVSITVQDLGSLVLPPLNIAGIAQYDPAQLQLEVAHASPTWSWAAGATYKRWSSYPGPVEPTVVCPDTQPDCAALSPPGVGYHDTVVPRVGVERAFALRDGLTLRARAGAFYERSPVPEQTRESNYLDADWLALTFGSGLTLADPLPPLDFMLFGQVHWLVPRTSTKDADIVAPAAGQTPLPGLPATNPGSPSVKLTGWALVGGVTAGVRF